MAPHTSPEVDRTLRQRLFGVKNGGKVEWNSDVDIGRGCGIFADVLKEEFGFCKVKILCIDEFRVRIRNGGS